jgi:hypothetical protein
MVPHRSAVESDRYCCARMHPPPNCPQSLIFISFRLMIVSQTEKVIGNSIFRDVLSRSRMPHYRRIDSCKVEESRRCTPWTIAL